MAPAGFGHQRVMESVGQDDSIITERKVETAALAVGIFFKKGSADMSAVKCGNTERALGVTRESYGFRANIASGDWDDYAVADKAVCVERTTQCVMVKTPTSSFADKAPIMSDANGLAIAATGSGAYVLGFADASGGAAVVTDRSGQKWVRIQPNWMTKEVVP